MTETRLSDRIRETVSFLTERGVGRPTAAVVLGSGLSGVLPLPEAASVPYGDIPGFPRGRVDGHEHRLEFGHVAGQPVLALRGRVHYYEGLSLGEITYPIRVARALGAGWIAMVNAAGGLDPEYAAGDIVLLTDHLNLMGDNPLIGSNEEELGPRFPDMSQAYAEELRERAAAAASAAGIAVRRGVYAAVTGPHYETAAEQRMVRLCGADLVGMSTVPETIVAVHGGLRVLGISVVTDSAAPAEPVSHGQVLTVAREAGPRVEAILRGVLEGEGS